MCDPCFDTLFKTQYRTRFQSAVNLSTCLKPDFRVQVKLSFKTMILKLANGKATLFAEHMICCSINLGLCHLWNCWAAWL